MYVKRECDDFSIGYFGYWPLSTEIFSVNIYQFCNVI